MLRDVYSDDGFTALHFAAYYGATQVLRILLERGARVGAMTTNFLANTPLHAAAAGRHMENCRLLLAAGADVNARQHGGFTPLHTPAQHGDRAMAQLFLDHGADPTIANDEGQTPIDLAVSQGNIELAALMRARAPAASS
jgi:ankyrin repeat protein